MKPNPLSPSLLIVALLAGAANSSLAATPDTPLANLRSGHPRLLVEGDSSFAEMDARIAKSALLRKWKAGLLHDADELLEAPLPRHVLPDGKRLLSTSREVMRRVYTLATAHRFTGDRRYLERCWRDVEAVSRFKDWNPNHFLDTAEMTHALGIAYDWLYADWTDSRRATIRKAIVELGLTPGLKSYRGEARYGWWWKSEHNWNQVCNGGLTVGALAIADEEPELATEILMHALKSVPKAMREFAPDGAYREGPSYWAYGVTYNVLMIAALESALGSDFGLCDHPGFERTVLFPISLAGPTGTSFNFADAKASRPGATFTMFWLARRFQLPEVARFAEPLAKGGALDLLWHREPSAKGSPLPTNLYWRGLEAATLRSSWTDPGAFFVAFKAGSPRINHAQADLGSFVLDALGERWAHDLGPDNYNLPGYFDRGKKRWLYFRNRAEGHNTLTIAPAEGPDQVVNANTKIVRFSDRADLAFGVMDLGPAYAPAATGVERGIALVDNRGVAVRDEIRLKKPAEVLWSLHTRAKIEFADKGRTARLSQNGKTLEARLVSPTGAVFTERPAAPLKVSPNPEGQKHNRGFRTLTVRLDGRDRMDIAVVFQSAGENQAATIAAAAARPLAEWKAP